MIGDREEAAELFLAAAVNRSELANVWAAVLSLCMFIACTVTVGVWLVRYHEEAQTLQPYMEEPTGAWQLLLDDCSLPL